MNKKIKSAIKDLSEFCNNGCDNEYIEDTICGMCKNPCEKGMSIITAIRSLKAWEEVLQELEKKNTLYMSYLSNKENPYDSELFGKHIAVENCIDIINQKLAEIEE